ncbi:unnamed protein product [Caenorhabditis angaria]|uniref:Uncharacterized protein n=1 Tax=Caenorhabditis angaria TaxID=860376 RepID=A0A9P1IM47_9PELO|nr:unnamed protein product [Caenorhabditis angaria]
MNGTEIDLINEYTKNWSNEYVKALVTKTVHRNKITEKFKNSKIEDVHKLLEILFEDESNDIHECYKSKDDLLKNIIAIQMFSNQMLYFGCRLNFNTQLYCSIDINEVKFITKHDALAVFHQEVHLVQYPTLSELMKISILREISRNLEDNNKSHEMIPFKLLHENVLHFRNTYFPRFSPYIEAVEIHQITRLFDSKHDIDLMLQMVAGIHQVTLGLSYSDKQLQYSLIHRYLSCWKKNIRKFFEDNHWFHDKYPVVQGFYETNENSDKSKFFMAKELENALEIALKKRYSKPFPKGLISIETEEERKLGILKIVDWETFGKIIKILKLSMTDIYILDVPIREVHFGHTSPISTPYGTYCKLALNSFIALFDEVANGMNLFRRGGLKKDNFPKIIEWFAKLTENDQVFSAYWNKRFLIETWKLEEIIDRAYIELEQFMTKSIRKLPNFPMKKFKAIKELCKLSTDYEELSLQFRYNFMNERSALAATLWPSDILLSHRIIIFNYMIACNKKVDKFCASQGYFLSFSFSTTLPEVNTKIVEIGEEDLKKMKEEEFMKILPTIPLHFKMTFKALNERINANISNRGPIRCVYKVEDKRKYVEICLKYTEFLDFAWTSENECLVKRKVIPSKRDEKYNDLILSDKKLLNTWNDKKGLFSKENFEAFCERLEEMRYEAENEEEVESITKVLKSLEIKNAKPSV